MSVIYNLCASLIASGRTDGLANKIDVMYLAGRLTDEQYKTLIERLNN